MHLTTQLLLDLAELYELVAGCRELFTRHCGSVPNITRSIPAVPLCSTIACGAWFSALSLKVWSYLAVPPPV
jgi:hypothetical protein